MYMRGIFCPIRRIREGGLEWVFSPSNKLGKLVELMGRMGMQSDSETPEFSEKGYTHVGCTCHIVPWAGIGMHEALIIGREYTHCDMIYLHIEVCILNSC